MYLSLNLWLIDLGQLKWNLQAGHLWAISQVDGGRDVILAWPQQVNCNIKNSCLGIVIKKKSVGNCFFNVNFLLWNIRFFSQITVYTFINFIYVFTNSNSFLSVLLRLAWFQIQWIFLLALYNIKKVYTLEWTENLKKVYTLEWTENLFSASFFNVCLLRMSGRSPKTMSRGPPTREPYWPGLRGRVHSWPGGKKVGHRAPATRSRSSCPS